MTRFPVIIFILIPVRTFLMPKWFRPVELGVLDAPTASAFTLESVGGSWGSYEGDTAVSSAVDVSNIPPEDVNEDAMEQGRVPREGSVKSSIDGIREVGGARARTHSKSE